MFCNHLLKTIKCIFMRIFKKKRMNPIEVKKSLDIFISEKFSEFHIYCKGKVSPWSEAKIEDVIQITKPQEPMEFACLGLDFVLEKEYYPFEGIGYLKTYQIVLDKQNYPNKKLIHLTDMDISIRVPYTTIENFKFRVDNITTQNFGKNIDGNPMQVPMNRAVISNFSIQYITQLYSILKKVHKDEWGT